MVIGLNHRTAPLAMRERFWISENRRYEVLRQLKSAEGIEEVVVLSTCCRTEFLLWAGEPTLAAAMSSVGAFSLSPTGEDTAMLVTLPPGGYTAQVSGVNSTTGVGLIEVYEVQ